VGPTLRTSENLPEMTPATYARNLIKFWFLAEGGLYNELGLLVAFFGYGPIYTTPLMEATRQRPYAVEQGYLVRCRIQLS
jgi:hypothetical protein